MISSLVLQCLLGSQVTRLQLDEPVLVIPSIRELTPKEKEFTESKWTKEDFGRYESVELPNGRAFIIVSQHDRNVRKTKQRLSQSLATKVETFGRINQNRLTDQDRKDICNLFWGQEPQPNAAFPPVSIHPSFQYQFKVDGTFATINLDAVHVNYDDECPRFEDLIKVPANTTMVVMSNREKNAITTKVEAPKAGLQVLFRSNSISNYDKALLISQASKAYAEWEIQELEATKKVLNLVVERLRSKESIEIDGMTFPEAVVDHLVLELQKQDPFGNMSIDEVKSAIRRAKVVGESRALDLILRLKDQHNGVSTYRLNLIKRQSTF